MDDLNLKLKNLIVDRLTLKVAAEDIDDEESLFGSDEDGLGLDSIDALDLVVGIYEEFGVEIQQDEMHIFENVNTLADFVRKRIASPAETESAGQAGSAGDA